MRPHVPVDLSLFLFCFYFRFFSKKSQSQQKLAKKITHFTIQFRPKNLRNFSANMFLFGVRKTFALHHSWTPKNCILEEFWKQRFACFFKYSSEKFCSTDILPSIDILRYLKRWNFPENVDFKGKILAKFLISDFLLI